MSFGRYHVEVGYMADVFAESREDALAQAMAEVRATVDQPALTEIVFVPSCETVQA